MTADRDLDRQLASWLDERATLHVPDGLLERSLGRVGATRQRPGWLVPNASRSPRAAGRPAATPARLRVVFACAVAMVVVVTGAGLFLRLLPAAVGGPSTQPSIAPSASASPSPTPASPTSLTGPIGSGRQIHTATRLVDGRVLIAGGYALGDGPLASAVLYDPGTNTFSPTGSLATARGYHTATLLSDGRVLIAGGGPAGWPGSLTGITGPFLASAELYDPTTGTFSPTGSMATPREVHTATLLADGRVLIAGGADFQARSVASAELYDPKTGTFSPTGSMTTARAFHTATLLADGRVLIAGGSPAAWGTTAHLASAEIYDPKAGTFTPTGPMAGGRDFNTATLLADGRVLIAGGSGLTQEDLASAEIYDPKTGTFTATGSLTNGREYQTATLLADGRVLIAGGGGDYTNRKFLASAELYDPKTGTFTATGSLATARSYQAATLLLDGKVLVTGGYGAVAPLASAEIYDPTTGTFTPPGSGG
jgi:Galactose oxidase, central domain/Kelch motif